MRFDDRREAGKVLAEELRAAHLPELQDALVLGLVRGGVPVAFELAMALGLALDAMIVRKIGAPGNPELAMGAVASTGTVVLNHEVLRAFGLSEEKLRPIIDEQKQEIERLEKLYRAGRKPIEFGARCVILVDDGLATGASMRAAIQAVRPHAGRLVVAVPVGARSTCAELAREVDHLVCAMAPEPLDAVSLFYRDFGPTSDAEVCALLDEAQRRSEPADSGE